MVISYLDFTCLVLAKRLQPAPSAYKEVTSSYNFLTIYWHQVGFPVLFIIYKAMLKKAGVMVVSINEAFDDTPTGRSAEGIIENLDEFYSDNLGE